jgi:hypothetical protein
MTKKMAIVVLLLALLCFMMGEATLAQTAQPGVRVGNTFTYEVKGFWSSSNANAVISNSILDLNATEYVQVNITKVLDADVSMHIVWRFTNGTVSETDSEIDVGTGMYTYWFWAVFPTNLNVGDKIHPYGPDMIKVNASSTRDIGDNKRETNRYLVTGEFVSTDNTNRTYNDYMTVHFDKQTGMLVELYDYKTYTNPEYSETITWKIIDSNAWDVPEFPMVALVIPLLIVAALLALIFYKKRSAIRKRRR